MIRLSSNTYIIDADRVEDAIEAYDEYDREDITIKKRNMFLNVCDVKTGLKLKNRGTMMLRPRGMTTLLQRVGMPVTYARKINDNLIERNVNTLLSEHRENQYIVRTINNEVIAVLSSRYGIMSDKTILEAVKEQQIELEHFKYTARDKGSITTINPIGASRIDLGEGYHARCDSSIENSDTAESSLKMFTSVNIFSDEDDNIASIHLRNSSEVMSRIIHSGNVSSRFTLGLDQFLESTAERIVILEGKFESLILDEDIDIAASRWASIINTITKKGSEQLKYDFLRTYPLDPRSNLEIFLRMAKFKVIASEQHKDLIDSIAEDVLW